MSKKEEDFSFAEKGWGNALLLFEDTISHHVGRMLTLVESWGMNSSQEKAVKNIVKQEIYQNFDSAWIIGEEDHSMLRKKAYKFGQYSCGGHQPQNMPPGRGTTPREVLPE